MQVRQIKVLDTAADTARWARRLPSRASLRAGPG